MTVLTKVKVSKKDDEPAQTHLVEERSDEDPEKAAAAAPEDEVDADAVRYMVLSQRARRINGSSICVLTAILLTFSLCLLCGLFYYRQTHRNDRLHAWCSFRFDDSTDVDDLLQPRPSDVELFDPPKDVPQRAAEPIQMLPVSHEEIDIDIKGNVESVFVPEFELGQSAHFLNDFSFPQTGIIPVGGGTGRPCLVIELDTTVFLEPGPMAERVRRIDNGFEESESLTVVREMLTVRQPAVSDPDSVSSHILRACAGLPIFAAEKRSVFKRSADGEQKATARFAVFGGRAVVQYTVANMPELE